MKEVLISGGTGFVGRHIVHKLLALDFKVFVLTRDQAKCTQILGDKVQPIVWSSFNDAFDTSLLSKNIGLINLVGESLTKKRWSENQKKKIYNSRVVATKNILETLRKSNISVDSFVSTSAIGSYSTGFLKEVCDDWEKAALSGKDICARISLIRTSVVLGASGGMIKEIAPIFKLGLGGRLGDGEQIMSWIHVEDLASLYCLALTNESFEGIYNGVARFNLSNKKFSEMFANLLGTKARFPVPEFALSLAKGQVAGMILESQDVKAQRLDEFKFVYKYPTAKKALEEIVSSL